MGGELLFREDYVDRLRPLCGFLKQHLLGQEEACERVAQLIWEGELGLCTEGKPRGSALLLGPTGTGKTELVRKVAEFLIDETSDIRLLRYDMANYRHAESLPFLLGKQLGEAGQWGADLDQLQGQSAILLFDELEKCHPSILPVFLAMLDSARLTCADGITRDLSRHYLFFTSNLASAELVHMERLPWESLQRKVLQQLESQFTPELCARIQECIVFRPLDSKAIRSLTVKAMRQHFRKIESSLNVSLHPDNLQEIESFLHSQIIWRYHQQKQGARMIHRTVVQLINRALLQYLQSASSPIHSALYLTLNHYQLFFHDADQQVIRDAPAKGLIIL